MVSESNVNTQRFDASSRADVEGDNCLMCGDPIPADRAQTSNYCREICAIDAENDR